jgi:hypothetical protein
VSKPSLRGVYVPIITPFSEEGAVATDALGALGWRLLDDGVAGLVPLGTAGEGALARDEKQPQSRLLTSLPLRRELRADHLGDQYDALPIQYLFRPISCGIKG